MDGIVNKAVIVVQVAYLICPVCGKMVHTSRTIMLIEDNKAKYVCVNCYLYGEEYS